MTEIEVIDIAKDALWVLLTAGAPVMMIAMGVGLIIALFQALTQIQEMTLTFVPKIIAVFLGLMIFLPFMLTTLDAFTDRMFIRMTEIGTYDRQLKQ
ncbi:MAG: flagellar biosynthesis protein FliQ [Rickettsiales bacterium]|nr:flagellar biosynthesis protein FliQ [Rickettsiales bacterium]